MIDLMQPTETKTENHYLTRSIELIGYQIGSGRWPDDEAYPRRRWMTVFCKPPLKLTDFSIHVLFWWLRFDEISVLKY